MVRFLPSSSSVDLPLASFWWVFQKLGSDQRGIPVDTAPMDGLACLCPVLLGPVAGTLASHPPPHAPTRSWRLFAEAQDLAPAVSCFLECTVGTSVHRAPFQLCPARFSPEPQGNN